PLYEDAIRLRRQFKQPVTFRHVRREQNKRADELCNEALDGLRTNTRLAPAKRSAPSEKYSPPASQSPSATGLNEQAIACLRSAAEAWARGAGSPSPEHVWQQLRALLKKHGLTLSD